MTTSYEIRWGKLLSKKVKLLRDHPVSQDLLSSNRPTRHERADDPRAEWAGRLLQVFEHVGNADIMTWDIAPPRTSSPTWQRLWDIIAQLTPEQIDALVERAENIRDENT